MASLASARAHDFDITGPPVTRPSSLDLLPCVLSLVDNRKSYSTNTRCNTYNQPGEQSSAAPFYDQRVDKHSDWYGLTGKS